MCCDGVDDEKYIIYSRTNITNNIYWYKDEGASLVCGKKGLRLATIQPYGKNNSTRNPRVKNKRTTQRRHAAALKKKKLKIIIHEMYAWNMDGRVGSRDAVKLISVKGFACVGYFYTHFFFCGRFARYFCIYRRFEGRHNLIKR